MLGEYLTRGVKAGLVAGLVFGLFVALVANPLVGVAETFEGGHGDEVGTHENDAAAHDETGADDAGGSEHEPVVSAATTKLVSVAGGVLWGVLLGAVAFGGAYYLLEPTIPGTTASKSYLLASAGFVTVSGAPWLVLPPLAPGVEATLPTTHRLGLYAAAMVAGALACLLAHRLYQRLQSESGNAVAVTVACLPLVALLGLTFVPTGGVAHSDLPAGLGSTFAAVVVFGQALLWLVLGTTHAHLQRRAGRRDDPGRPVASSANDPQVTAD